MQTQITPKRVIKEETEELSKKPLCHPPSGNRSTRQSVGIHGWAKDPPSLIYPLYLSLPSSYSNKASRNRVLSNTSDPTTSSMLHLPSLASSNTFQQHQKPYLTLSKGVVSICTINLSMVWKWRGRRWGNSTNKCVDFNSQVFLLGFSLRNFPLHLWVMRVYIVWVQKVCIR